MSVTALATTSPSSVSDKKKKDTSTCLVYPTRFTYEASHFEYSVYAPSSRFLRELRSVFPDLSPKQQKSVLVIPVIQHCQRDMVGITNDVNHERDVKLETFVSWGKRVVTRLRSVGMWADIMDPASGFPIFSAAGPTPYPDVQGTQALTQYDVQNVGCCHILLHPTWKSHIYPATMFTTAPSDILVKVINEIAEAE
ncbi:uncharacterized protein BYT42DRAFT_549751 [Radiomyces spectabilis]|uniref:uncharacterized protein n=1 Tax=Radiomyces spectabilis TaxID=64574 RepID=UPI00221EE04E|nr:uncharacterized protein BYT42DRAFT_549751 [Radiomyces spectabilis]KAI8366666.1 hypothetical protein BYT42DRAFT_549751 [Radiomyces spectabilis]